MQVIIHSSDCELNIIIQFSLHWALAILFFLYFISLFTVSFLLLIIILERKSMTAYRTVRSKWKPKNHYKFWVSIFLLAPPMGQRCSDVCNNNFWTLRPRNKMLFPLLDPEHAMSTTTTPLKTYFNLKIFWPTFPKFWLDDCEAEPKTNITFLQYTKAFLTNCLKNLMTNMLFLCIALSFWDETLYLSSQAWLEGTCTVLELRLLLVKWYEHWLCLLITSKQFDQKSWY